MLAYTLDTNCIVALERGEPEAFAIRKLIDAHFSGKANVALVAISASEKQQNKYVLESFDEFQSHLESLHIGDLELLPCMLYWDITYWDRCIWSSDENEQQERRIHTVLFPNIQFLCEDFCKVRGVDANSLIDTHKWRNAKCDVQAMWSHIFHKRDVFVTSDKNFHKDTKKALLASMEANRIEKPESALALVR